MEGQLGQRRLRQDPGLARFQNPYSVFGFIPFIELIGGSNVARPCNLNHVGLDG
jgi:hypothetical protein